MLAALGALSSNSSLSSAHGKWGYFLAKPEMSEKEGSIPIKLINCIRWMTSSAESVGSLGQGPWAVKQARGAGTIATAAVTVTVFFS
uniref:Uncharacterized protein n=1 Tax=Romanomermis culicivorax TaxID=13658 RepID=A0A915K5J0_ROMCU